jgi:single-stranded-DNA-specific exonuclease
MSKYNWQIKKRIFSDPVKQILFNRQLIDQNEHLNPEVFLEPDFDRDLCNSKLLPDYKKFDKRIILALKRKEKIGIYADYDADGIPGAAFLSKALSKIGLENEIYIPSRDEGYGLNKTGIDYLINRGCSLIITVDLGIKEHKNAEYIYKKKCDLIITDHHIPDDSLPRAIAVVNPKISGSKYKFNELSGAGVVFKLIYGLKNQFPDRLTEHFLKWNLDLIAISTISDVVPLIGENRVIAKFGLISLQKTKNLGLKKLYQVISIDPKKINEYTIGFQIGPRINAPGRLGEAIKPFKLLTTNNDEEAIELAKELNNQNGIRQEAMDQVFVEASLEIEREKLNRNKIIILASKWPRGVIGPAASRLSEKFLRPIIVFSKEGDTFHGSARSIKGFDIVEALRMSEKLLVAYGGHKGAAGVEISSENFSKFHQAMLKIASRKITKSMLEPKIEIDLIIDSTEINLKLFHQIEKLQPFGMGNPRPVLLIENVQISEQKIVGRDGKHLKFIFNRQKDIFEGIFFGFFEKGYKLDKEKKYDVVFRPEVNYFNGNEKVSLNIIDIKENGSKKEE